MFTACVLLQQKLPGVCGMTVNEVVKGGSLGLGTTVPESGRFNVDLVIYSKGIYIIRVILGPYNKN